LFLGLRVVGWMADVHCCCCCCLAESDKPRGVVDLSKVQDVKDGRSVTGKANTVQLKTASGGSVCYVCESGTSLWDESARIFWFGFGGGGAWSASPSQRIAKSGRSSWDQYEIGRL
jgi:hypothetical protein